MACQYLSGALGKIPVPSVRSVPKRVGRHWGTEAVRPPGNKPAWLVAGVKGSAWRPPGGSCSGREDSPLGAAPRRTPNRQRSRRACGPPGRTSHRSSVVEEQASGTGPLSPYASAPLRPQVASTARPRGPALRGPASRAHQRPRASARRLVGRRPQAALARL